jgi:hypothetical protein
MSSWQKIISISMVFLFLTMPLTSKAGLLPDNLQFSYSGDQEKIDSLSRKQLKEIQELLNKATKLFYNKSFRLALLFVQDAADIAETQEILYLTGQAAFYNLQPDLAVENFKAILKKQPKLNQVRIALALAYLQQQNINAAKQELNNVLGNNAVKTVKEQTRSILARLYKPKKPLSFSALINVGVLYDNNIASNPDERRRASSIYNIEGFALAENLNFDFTYDFGDQKKYLWQNQLKINHLDYNEKQNFDYTQVDVQTSINNYQDDYRVKIPIGWHHRQFGGKTLSDSFFIAPDFILDFSKTFNLNLNITLENEQYELSKRQGQNNLTWDIKLKPALRYEADWLQIISLEANYRLHGADNDSFSYDDWILAPSHYCKYEYDISSYFAMKFLDRNYYGFNALGRKDSKISFTALINKVIAKKYSISLTYTYTDNNSNIGGYDYNKQVFGLNFGALWTI